MSTAATPNRPVRTRAEQLRQWLRPLNLHLAGVALLVVINVYLLAQLIFLWQQARSNNSAALAQQKIALTTAELGAQPLRGLDDKLAKATAEADSFYQHRLPGTDSEVLTELGGITKEYNVKLTRGQYLHAPVLAGTPWEVTEMRIDASLSGDYRPLVQMINSLERDRMFFVIDAVTLSGQQSGTVNLRLRLRTYLRGHVNSPDTGTAAPADEDTAVTPAPASTSAQEVSER